MADEFVVGDGLSVGGVAGAVAGEDLGEGDVAGWGDGGGDGGGDGEIGGVLAPVVGDGGVTLVPFLDVALTCSRAGCRVIFFLGEFPAVIAVSIIFQKAC